MAVVDDEQSEAGRVEGGESGKSNGPTSGDRTGDKDVSRNPVTLAAELELEG